MAKDSAAHDNRKHKQLLSNNQWLGIVQNEKICINIFYSKCASAALDCGERVLLVAVRETSCMHLFRRVHRHLYTVRFNT